MPITPIELSTQKYFAKAMEEEQNKHRHVRIQKALGDLALGLFGALAILGSTLAVEQIDVWLPSVLAVLRSWGVV
jgi:hypothetical protein